MAKMKNEYSIIIMILPLIIFACTPTARTIDENKFVQVKNSQFYFQGKPYYFVGTNLWYGAYLGSPGETGDRERLVRELDNLVANGITNLRICAASEESKMERSTKPAFTKSPGVYDDELLLGLDFLLAEMGKRGMHAVLFLNNYWQWSGGMAQYNSWFGGGEVPDPDDPNVGYAPFMDFSAQFYKNNEAKKEFKKYVKMIVTRQNSITGKYYFEDPAIMAWQLANEPRPGRIYDEEIVNYFFEWVDQTAEFIHSLDPNHLVTTGNEGLHGSLTSEEIFLKMHSSKYIDYATVHLWPKNWGWFKADQIEETYPQTEINAIDYIQKHFLLCKKLNKPFTLEEFGIPRDFEKYEAGTPTTARDKYFKNIFAFLYESAVNGEPIAGTNFWAWGGEGRGKDDFVWKKGDPYTGDPAQEPQGLNSVFDSDESTLKIIREHSQQIKNLNNEKIISAKMENNEN